MNGLIKLCVIEYSLAKNFKKAPYIHANAFTANVHYYAALQVAVKVSINSLIISNICNSLCFSKHKAACWIAGK